MKIPFTFIFTLGLSFLLAGCLSTPAPQLPRIENWSAATVAEKSASKRDDFKKFTSVTSPDIAYDLQYSGTVYQKFYLHAEKSDNGTVKYFLTVETQRAFGMSWAFWKEAFDKDGQKFPLTDGFREVIRGDVVRENSYANVTREYLERSATTGTLWKIYGQRAESSFVVPSNLIVGFLIKCDQVFSK